MTRPRRLTPAAHCKSPDWGSFHRLKPTLSWSIMIMYLGFNIPCKGTHG